MITSSEMIAEYFRDLHYRVELTAEEKEQIANLLHRYRGCFATSLTDVERTKVLEHQVRVPEGTRPVYRQGMKRFRQPELAFIKEQVEAQLNAEIIRENGGSWCALVTLGWNKSGTYKFCAERGVNLDRS